MPIVRTSIVAAAGAWLSLVAIPASAAPPAAPVVTVGADIKQLQFDWNTVAGANYYELWNKADNGSPWTRFFEKGASDAQAINNISAHLFNWDQARYQLKACNSSGCSASPELAVHDEMLESLGYFKPSATYAAGEFGSVAAISEDGQTFASFALEPNANNQLTTVLYVFAKANGTWSQQSRIVPVSTVPGLRNWPLWDPFEGSLSLSGDGNVLAVGLAMTAPNGAPRAATTIYRRSGGAWSLEKQFVSSIISPDSSVIGFTTNMDEAGDRIAFRRWSNRPVELLERTSSGWSARGNLPQPPAELFCYDAKLSGDGQTLVNACATQDATPVNRLFISHAPDWQIATVVDVAVPDSFVVSALEVDATASTIAATIEFVGSWRPGLDITNQVIVLRNSGGTWNQFAALRRGAWNPADEGALTFGINVALSRNGGWLAVSDTNDHGAGIGVVSPPLAAGPNELGATYIYDLRGAAPRLRRVLKLNTPDGAVLSYYYGLAFANDGKTLLRGDANDMSRATGIDGDRNDKSLNAAGAIWLY